MTMALRRAKAAPATAMSYLSVLWCAAFAKQNGGPIEPCGAPRAVSPFCSSDCVLHNND